MSSHVGHVTPQPLPAPKPPPCPAAGGRPCPSERPVGCGAHCAHLRAGDGGERGSGAASGTAAADLGVRATRMCGPFAGAGLCRILNCVWMQLPNLLCVLSLKEHTCPAAPRFCTNTSGTSSSTRLPRSEPSYCYVCTCRRCHPNPPPTSHHHPPTSCLGPCRRLLLWLCPEPCAGHPRAGCPHKQY